jgi:hypothetical protein
MWKPRDTGQDPVGPIQFGSMVAGEIIVVGIVGKEAIGGTEISKLSS